MTHPLLQGFRGAAQEVALIAKTLADGTQYQPKQFTKNNLAKGFELLLQPLRRDGDNEAWTADRISAETGINVSAIRDMRIALIVLGLLPYNDDCNSTQPIRDIWAALNDPNNADKSYTEIAKVHQWDLDATLRYARIGRFTGKVASRDESKSRPVIEFAPIKIALTGNAKAACPELQQGDFNRISEMLAKATDSEDGYFENRTIKYIADTLGINRVIVGQVRVGLVTAGILPERKPIDRAKIKAMWVALEQNTDTRAELLAKHQDDGWDKQSLFRAGILGRLVGEVSTRVIRNKSRMLPRILRVMDRYNITPSEAARRFKIKPATVRQWLEDSGETQQVRIEKRRVKLLALAVGDGADSTIKQLAETLNWSEASISKDLLLIGERLAASDKADDKAMLAILQPRLDRMALAKQRKQKKSGPSSTPTK